MENNQNVDLIRKMLSLVESTNIKTQSIISEEEITSSPEHEIDEQPTQVAKGGAEVLANVLKSERGLFQTIKNEIPALSKFKNVDDAIKALESGTMATADSFAILKQAKKVPEIASKLKGLVGDSKTFQEIAKQVYPKGTLMPANSKNLEMAKKTLEKTYGMTAAESEAALKTAFQKASGEVKSVSSFKGVKGGNPALNPNKLKGSSPEISKFVTQNVAKPAEEVAKGASMLSKIGDKGAEIARKAAEQLRKFKPDVFERLKKLKGRLNAKQLALYGLAGFGLYELLKGMFGEDGKNTNGIIPACIANLDGVDFVVGTGDVAVAKIASGIDEKSSGHGGLFFWPNGRAITGDGKVRGSYYCKGTSGGPSDVAAKLQEQSSDFSKYSNIHIDWDGEKKKEVTPNPNPKPKPKPSPYKQCKGFPFSYGCKNDLIREIQVCLGFPNKLQTGNYGPKTQSTLKEGGYDLSKGITEDIYKAVLTACKNKRPELEKIEPIKMSGIKPMASTGIKLPELTSLIQSNQKPVDLYKAFKDAGLLRGDAESTTLEDGTVLPPTNRVKYKGPELDSEILDKLDEILSGMGYDRIKQKLDKRYGEKYVWLKK
jgi:hypothetical protein